MSSRLGAEIRFFHWKFRKKVFVPLKYPILSFRTLKFLFKSRPRLIFAQSPPTVCPIVCQIYSTLYSSRLIVDAHTGTWEKPWKWLQPFNMWAMKRSLITVYHDHVASQLLASWKVKALFLEDKVPELSGKPKPRSSKNFRLVFVSTFSEDEPVEEVLKAARMLPSVEFFITGNPSYAKPEYLTSRPRNVIFTGYLPESDYIDLLRGSDGVIVLSTKNKTELAGCYEALAVGKPIITSNWPSLRSTFHTGTLYVDNTADSIVASVNYLAVNRERLTREIRLLKKRKDEDWERNFARLEDVCAGAETGKV